MKYCYICHYKNDKYMCAEINIISKTKNGMVFQCKSCENYQVVFNNLNFSFTDKEYFYFSKYISGIDLGHYENHFNDDLHGKKIQLPIGHKNLLIALNCQELRELQHLFNHKITEDYSLINLDKIHYKLFMN